MNRPGVNRSRDIVIQLALSILSVGVAATELPRLPGELSPQKQTYAAQQKLPEEKRLEFRLGQKHRKQACFQKLFELTAPVTPQSKAYKYVGSYPSIVMMIIDIKAPGTAQEFIAKELAGKIGATYYWEDQPCGIPKCGAGSNWTSRDLVKFGSIVIRGGKWRGEQLLHPAVRWRRRTLNHGGGDSSQAVSQEDPAALR